VEDVIDVGLGGEAAEGSAVVFGCGGLDGGDAKVLAALGEPDPGEGDAGFGIGGDSGVVVEDQVAVRRDAVCIDLCSRAPGREEGKKNDTAEEKALEERCSGSAESGYAGSGLVAVEHCCTSKFGLRCASAAAGFA
jgi:hypothetical protein